MFRFSASSRQLQFEEVEDIVKNWGKLALAGIFLASSLLLPHAEANPSFTMQASQMVQPTNLLLTAVLDHLIGI